MWNGSLTGAYWSCDSCLCIYSEWEQSDGVDVDAVHHSARSSNPASLLYAAVIPPSQRPQRLAAASSAASRAAASDADAAHDASAPRV